MLSPEDFHVKSCSGDKEVSTLQPMMVDVSGICLFCAKGENHTYYPNMKK